MCLECGCGEVSGFTIQPMQNPPSKKLNLVDSPADRKTDHREHSHRHDNDHHHNHPGHHDPDDHGHSHHSHGQDRDPGNTHVVDVNLSLTARNDRLAERNRGFFQGKGILAINIVSSPGSGKTTLIEKTVEMVSEQLKVAVIVGDLETANDAVRIRKKGAVSIQVTTGTVCHLDAEMVARSLESLDLDGVGLVIIENVGNLVCPASFDLGEALRVVMLSTTEGEDKPLKYPPIFSNADVVILNKIDIAEAVDFNRQIALRNIHQVVPAAKLLEVSAKTGLGMESWIEFILSYMD